ncbi:MAG: metal ABC transporter permease [Paracoccaceae bacterium]
MLDDFLIRASLAGFGIALAAAPLGCFVVWRRMAYFGDATAHAAILGVALALALGLPVFLGALCIAVLMAFAVMALRARGTTSDTGLGVLSHAALAIGLLAASLLSGPRLDLMSFLLGDILAVSRGDLALIWGGGALVIGLILWRWNALLIATLNPDLAHAAGVDPRREEVVLTLTLAVVVALAIKVVGVLLIAALLLIPAAAARAFASTPERMAILAACIGAVSALGGVQVSLLADSPTGPTIVTCAAVFFALSLLVPKRRPPKTGTAP